MSDAAQPPTQGEKNTGGQRIRNPLHPTVEDDVEEDEAEPELPAPQSDIGQPAEQPHRPSRSRPRPPASTGQSPNPRAEQSVTFTAYTEEGAAGSTQEEIESHDGAAFADDNSSFIFSFGDRTADEKRKLMSVISKLSDKGVSAVGIATIVSMCGFTVAGIVRSDPSQVQSSDSTT